MPRRPTATEAAPYYFTYIDKVAGEDVLAVLETQLEGEIGLLEGISEEGSLHRYAPEKWTLREVVSHINDCERLFVFRAFWFARGFTSPLPSFDQNVGVAGARPDAFPWASHLAELRAIRAATLSFFHNLPAEGWERTGTASDNPFSVRALAFIAAGHFAHHLGLVRERYL
jgi:hypothetical protein